MRRGLLALGVFVAFIVAELLFRGGPPSEVVATAIPDGAWETTNCDALPDGFGLADARDRCRRSEGVARFQLNITNETEGTVAVTGCTVTPVPPDAAGGIPEGGAPIIVPVRAMYGVPYTAAYLGSGDSVSMAWFVPWLGPAVNVRYEATCDWSPFSGPLPL